MTSGKFIDLTGVIFGRLLVIERVKDIIYEKNKRRKPALGYVFVKTIIINWLF